MAPMRYISDDKESVHLNLAKLKKGGEHFEVPVNVEEAIAFKEGKSVDVKDIIDAPNIFSDAQKGELASETHMKTVFGTSDPYEVAKIILKDGEIQLTSEIRDKARQRKFNQLVAQIARDAMDPKTKLPHPPERIRLAMDEAKVRVDEFRTVDQQLEDVINKLRPILPISFEKKMLSFTIPGEFAGKAQNVVRSKGGLKEESWGNEGEWTVLLELSGGMAQEITDQLNSLTHGRVNIKEI
jgi:ribosome maturation protein SDO1